MLMYESYILHSDFSLFSIYCTIPTNNLSIITNFNFTIPNKTILDTGNYGRQITEQIIHFFNM